MTPIYTEAELDVLAGPHVQRAFFADVQFGAGIGRRRFHTGVGSIFIGGETWEGVNDPFGGQMVSLAGIMEARFGQAPALKATFSGVDKEWFRSLWTTNIEGKPCDIYFAVFDAETGAVLIDLKLKFMGRISSPSFEMTGLAIRAVTVTIVSRDEGLNFPATKQEWSPAGQRARYPGDKGLDFVGADVIENFKAGSSS